MTIKNGWIYLEEEDCTETYEGCFHVSAITNFYKSARAANGSLKTKVVLYGGSSYDITEKTYKELLRKILHEGEGKMVPPGVNVREVI